MVCIACSRLAALVPSVPCSALSSGRRASTFSREASQAASSAYSDVRFHRAGGLAAVDCRGGRRRRAALAAGQRRGEGGERGGEGDGGSFMVPGVTEKANAGRYALPGLDRPRRDSCDELQNEGPNRGSENPQSGALRLDSGVPGMCGSAPTRPPTDGQAELVSTGHHPTDGGGVLQNTTSTGHCIEMDQSADRARSERC